MRPLSDYLADMIEEYRQPGEAIAAAADRILYQHRPPCIDAAIREVERRERWTAAR